FDAEAAKNAAQLVDHELLGITFCSAAWVAFWVLGGLDVDALRRASGRTTQARHAARRAVAPLSQTVNPAKALRVRPFLFGVRDAVDALFDRLEHWIVALPEHHLLRVLEEVAHGNPDAPGDLGNVALHRRGAIGARHGLAHDLSRS